MRFLFIDDNTMFRSFLREFIIKEGDEFMELIDGLNLNNAYREFQPDWVLLDIPYKNGNGIKAARLLKEEFPLARLIFVTDYTDQRFRKEAAKTGATAFIPKENLFELHNIIYPET
jgi:DNA-binding NarL/FixJ family response regulator